MYIRYERVTYLADFDDSVCWLVYWKVWGGRFPIPGPLIRPWVMAASHLSSLKIYAGNHRMKYKIKMFLCWTSVAEPKIYPHTVTRSRDAYSWSRKRIFSILDPRSIVKKIPDTGSASKNWSILTQKLFPSSSNIIWEVPPGSGPWFFPRPDPDSGPRICNTVRIDTTGQWIRIKSGQWNRIQNPDPREGKVPEKDANLCFKELDVLS